MVELVPQTLLEAQTHSVCCGAEVPGGGTGRWSPQLRSGPGWPGPELRQLFF